LLSKEGDGFPSALSTTGSGLPNKLQLPRPLEKLSLNGVIEQVVDTQLPLEQVWSAPQEAQAPPFFPHAEVLVPPLQVVPAQQPAQSPNGHVPPHPSEAFAHLPVQLGVQIVWHTPLEHTWFAPHVEHVPPFFPQAAVLVPPLQVVPAQQPVQLFEAHVPPQPSEAPAHLPAQFGVHCPEGQATTTLSVSALP
jgi:hypothetical protein